LVGIDDEGFWFADKYNENQDVAVCAQVLNIVVRHEAPLEAVLDDLREVEALWS
jgi:hypothetical protein